MIDLFEEKISNIIAKSLEALGYGILRVKMLSSSRSNTLQITIERLDNKAITINDCEKASHTISALLDVEDAISGKYNLEVTSKGLDVLLKLSDYQQHICGPEVRITTKKPLNGRKKFKGTIENIRDNIINIKLSDVKSEDIAIDYNNIDNAKLVLTDELIRKIANQQLAHES